MSVRTPAAAALAAVMLAGAGGGAPEARAGTALPAPAHLTGPPPGHTGGFGEPTCQVCHEGDALNAFGGRVRVEGLPPAWEPGRAYTLNVVLEMEETSVAGFQLAARWAGGPLEGRPAGALEALSSRVAVTLGERGQPYAHQTEEGTEVPDPSGSSWTVAWRAPEGPAAAGGNGPGAPGSGEVVFHVAANSGNGDNSPLLDLVYTAEAVVPAARRRDP